MLTDDLIKEIPWNDLFKKICEFLGQISMTICEYLGQIFMKICNIQDRYSRKYVNI